MQYGYYDEKSREYVLSRPVTPVPWTNVLGTPEYTAVISHNAGGASFRKSSGEGRVLRSGRPPFDAPGRYIYIRDNKSLDYWSASWQPVGKDLRQYISECRHGLGYTTMRAEYDNIRTDVLYYVPKDQEYEVWYVNVNNRSDQIRHLTITGFAEFTNDPNFAADAEERSHSRFLSRTHFHDNRIVQTLGENAGTPYASRFLGLAGAETASYCGDLSAFLGLYRGYGNPLGVERGDLRGKLNYNENSCGALSTVVVLKPGASMDMAFVLGEKNDEEAGEILRRYHIPQAVCRQEWLTLKTWWEERLSRLQVQTPDPDFNQMVNTWDPLGAMVSFLWSHENDRTRGFQEAARMAEILPGYAALDPDQTGRKLRALLAAQKIEGGCGTFRLLPAVSRYLCETGRMDFLEEHISFSDAWDDSVYDHLKRAVDLPERRFGPHGLLFAAGSGELLPEGAESVVSTMQLWDAMGIMARLAGEREDREYEKELQEKRSHLGEVLEKAAWREDRYLYGILADGAEVGSSQSLEATLWLLPQVTAIRIGLAGENRAKILRERIQEELDSPFGARRMVPPYRHALFPGMVHHLTNAYVGENGSILQVEQAGRILMETREGHGSGAYANWRKTAPAVQNETSEIYRQAPYCYGTYTESVGSPHAGTAHRPWFSAAAPAMALAVAEGILGIRPELRELVLSPCLPPEWQEITVDRILRDRRLHIVIRNPEGIENTAVKTLKLNGETLPGNRIPFDRLLEENEILLELGENRAAAPEEAEQDRGVFWREEEEPSFPVPAEEKEEITEGPEAMEESEGTETMEEPENPETAGETGEPEAAEEIAAPETAEDTADPETAENP